MSRVFLIQMTSSTGLRNCDATRTSICRMVFSGVLLTLMPILTSSILRSRAFMSVVVPMLVSVSSFSVNSAFSKGSTTVMASFFSLKTVTITSYPSNLYWFDPFALSIYSFIIMIKICSYEISPKLNRGAKIACLQYYCLQMSRQKQLLEVSMEFRAGSSKNTSLLSKGRKKELYHKNLPAPTLAISTSVNLTSNEHITPNNFILANKKNLHNFFKDRIPNDKIIVGQKVAMLSPTKIFKLRKQQNQRQQGTKIKLTRSFETQQQIFKTPSTKKMNETFHISDKNKEILFNSISQTSKCFRLQSSASTYQTPTSSSMVKRSNTVKKQAYISVFGDRLIEQKARVLEIQSATNLTMFENQRPIKKQKIRPKTNLSSRVEEQREKLGKLLQKIEGFANFVNPHRMNSQKKGFQEACAMEIPFEAKQELQTNELVDWIKAVSNGYKQKNQDFKINRMRTLEDIEKMDPNFYTRMKSHKNGRLWVRNKALHGIQFSQKLKNIKCNHAQMWQDQTQKQDWIDQLLTITDRNGNTIQQVKIQSKNKYQGLFEPRTLTRKQKLAKFGANLIRCTNLAKLYSIKMQNIYIALIKKRKPYQLEGSYAFFKYIKSDNIKFVQSFIFKNQQYAYQVDNELRTTLIYAVQNNSLRVVKFLLQMGINVDSCTAKGQTALSLAILNNNYKAVQYLLRGGASPWSSACYDMKQMFERCDFQIKLAVKNARKIHIARSLIKKPKLKDQFWQQYACKIQGSRLISFY